MKKLPKDFFNDVPVLDNSDSITTTIAPNDFKPTTAGAIPVYDNKFDVRFGEPLIVLEDKGCKLAYYAYDYFVLYIADYVYKSTHSDITIGANSFTFSKETYTIADTMWECVEKALSGDMSDVIGQNGLSVIEFIKKRYHAIRTIKESEFDVVKKPSHYNSGKYEVIDIIESVVCSLGLDPFKSYCMGNAIKYICRAGLKGDFKEDIKKAIMYLNWAMGEDPRK